EFILVAALDPRIFDVARLSDFFFSSRRRHTRSKRDWSSDVCSSDLRFRGGYRAHVAYLLLQRLPQRFGWPLPHCDRLLQYGLSPQHLVSNRHRSPLSFCL